MPTQLTTLKHDCVLGFLSPNSVGTDALNALGAIDIVNDVEVISERDDTATLMYSFDEGCEFWSTNEHLAKFGLLRVG
jgi:hypothetical protein